MWPTVLTSALLGAGVAFVTSEPHGQESHFSAPPQRSLQGVTCQIRPDMRLVPPGPCQGGTGTVESCAYHGFMSLSSYPTTCDLFSADALDTSIQFTPYCNDTQMNACAEATGGFWRQHGSADFPKGGVEAPSASIIRVMVAPLANFKLGTDGGYQRIILPRVPPQRTNFEEHETSTTSPREGPQTAANDARVADMAMENEDEILAPSRKVIPPAIDAMISAYEKPGISSPSWTGNKQLAGMAAALTTVLIIFVVWL